MATVEELLRAAKNADAAGDTEAARALVQAAKSVMEPQVTAGQVGPENPDFSPVQLPPRADNPTPATPQIDRFGDTIKDAVEGPLAMTQAFAAGLVDQNRSPTRAALPEGMPNAIKAPVAAVGDLAMTGLGALGSGFAFGAGLAGEVFGGSPTNEKKLARDLIMMGEVSAPELSGVSSTVMAGGRAARAAERLAPKSPRQAAARAADDLGITPSLGMTGKPGAMVSAAMEKFPVTANTVAKDATRAVGEVEGVFSRIRSGIGTALSPDAAGGVLQSGLQKFVDGFKETSGRLFRSVDAAMPQDARFPLSNTITAIQASKEAFTGNPELARKLGLNQWDAILSEAEANGVSWQALKQFRTKVGEAIGDATGRSALSDQDLGRLKQIYGALTQDMEAAARSVGDDAYRSWTRANRHYKAGSERIERSLDGTITAKTPERAWEAFSNLLSADRMASDVTRVRQIKASMPKEDWDTVSASIVERLGKAPAGQQGAAGDTFSPAVFLTNWNKMAPEARRLLLPEAARIELEKLALVAEQVKASGAERNMSNTGNVASVLTAMAGFQVAPTATTATIAGTYIGAKALTSPVFLRAMNAMARGDAKQMRAIANGNGPFAMDARTVMRMTAAETAATGGANTNREPRAVSGQ